MIQLTSYLSTTPLAVNPKQVLYVKEAPAQQGCVLYFSTDKAVHVSNNYLEVVGLLTAHQQ
jgi:6-phosphogluconolactonase (cycloisomerase 2 family)